MEYVAILHVYGVRWVCGCTWESSLVRTTCPQWSATESQPVTLVTGSTWILSNHHVTWPHGQRACATWTNGVRPLACGVSCIPVPRQWHWPERPNRRLRHGVLQSDKRSVQEQCQWGLEIQTHIAIHFSAITLWRYPLAYPQQNQATPTPGATPNIFSIRAWWLSVQDDWPAE